jgi:hypothetical protein
LAGRNKPVHRFVPTWNAVSTDDRSSIFLV